MHDNMTGRNESRTRIHLATAAVALLAGASLSSALSLSCYSTIRNNVKRRACAVVVMSAGKPGSSKSSLIEDRTENELLGITKGSTPRRPKITSRFLQAIHPEATGGSDGQPVLGLDGGNMNAEFQSAGLLSGLGNQDSTSVFSVSETDGHDQSQFDREAFDKRNILRKKFGLPPISADEFVEIQSQVKQLDASQRSKAQASASAAEVVNRQKKKQSIFSKLLGNVLEDSCESNWDCERPEVCCDLGFKKMCCSSGLAVFTGLPQQRLERAMVPVPADPGFPRGGPDGNMDNWY